MNGFHFSRTSWSVWVKLRPVIRIPQSFLVFIGHLCHFFFLVSWRFQERMPVNREFENLQKNVWQQFAIALVCGNLLKLDLVPAPANNYFMHLIFERKYTIAICQLAHSHVSFWRVQFNFRIRLHAIISWYVSKYVGRLRVKIFNYNNVMQKFTELKLLSLYADNLYNICLSWQQPDWDENLVRTSSLAKM